MIRLRQTEVIEAGIVASVKQNTTVLTEQRILTELEKTLENPPGGKEMSDAIDRRDYLVSLGLAKPGRGRFSADAKAALAEAEKNGIKFLEKGAITTTVVTINDDGERVNEVRSVDPYAPHPEPFRTDGFYKFVKENGGSIKVSVSEACIHCKFSFGWCLCPKPSFRYWRTGDVYVMEDAHA